jgi:ELWxxDGT repeat protein
VRVLLPVAVVVLVIALWVVREPLAASAFFERSRSTILLTVLRSNQSDSSTGSHAREQQSAYPTLGCGCGCRYGSGSCRGPRCAPVSVADQAPVPNPKPQQEPEPEPERDPVQASWHPRLARPLMHPSAAAAFWPARSCGYNDHQSRGPVVRGSSRASRLAPFVMSGIQGARFMLHAGRPWWLGTLLLIPTICPAAETPELVKDLSTAREAGTFAPSPVRAGGLVFFLAAVGESGYELWRTDGTPAGTRLARDIRPGPGSSEPREAVAAGALCYFVADDGEHGAEVWRSDGTEAGTFLLADLLPPDTGRAPYELTAAGDRLYFFIDPPAGDVELWTSDGTAGSARRVAALAGGRDGFSPRRLGVSGSLFYFTLPLENDLWRSDGTPEGTFVLKDIDDELETFTPRAAAEKDGALYFFARAGEGFDELRHELWRSDGTPGGTGPTGWSASVYPREMVLAGDRLFFALDTIDDDDGLVGSAIWSSDGTAAGTSEALRYRLTDADTAPRSLVAQGSRVCYWLGSFALDRYQVWTTDGTDAGTRVLHESSDYPGPLAAAGDGRVFFAATPRDGGAAVWGTDGSPAGTKLAAALASGQLEVTPDGLVGYGAGVLFHLQGTALGRELWASDGSAAGTLQVRAGLALAGEPSDPRELASLGDAFVFIARDNRRAELLWRSDGTGDGTLPLLDSPGPQSWHLGETEAASGRVFFTLSTDDGDEELWATDGTGPGTTRVQTFPQDGFRPRALTATGSRLFFLRGEDFGEDELWQHGGSPASTERLRPGLARAGELTPLGEQLLFLDAPGAATLWRSDGTAAGTVPLRTYPEAEGSPYVHGLTVLGDRAYFIVQPDFFDGGDLWVTDGTEAGTQAIKEFPDGPDAQRLVHLAAAGSTVFLIFAASNRGTEVWTSDGSEPGTVRLRELSVDPPSFDVPRPVSLGSVLLFGADDGSGEQLWRSDGTVAGTFAVTSVHNEAQAPGPQALFAAGSLAYFSLLEDAHGRELWASDGTAAGTRRVADIRPGPKDSWPRHFHEHGGRLYFAADDGVHGSELWRLAATPAAPRRGDVNGDGALNLTDAVAILECLFRGATICGTELCARDSNGDGQVNISDPVYLLVHLFLGGPGLAACP